MDIEKRQSLRKQLRIKAMLTVDGRMPMKVNTIDIGKFGMCLNGVLYSLDPGQAVGVAFQMVCSGKIYDVAANARISHCTSTINDGFKAGLQFVNLDSEVAAMLAQYVGT